MKERIFNLYGENENNLRVVIDLGIFEKKIQLTNGVMNCYNQNTKKIGIKIKGEVKIY